MMNKSLRARERESSGPFIKQGIWFPASRDSSFRGESEASEPGIQMRCAVLDSGFARRRAPRNDDPSKKEPPFPAAFEVNNREASNRVDRSHSVSQQGRSSNSRESLIDRKRTVLFKPR